MTATELHDMLTEEREKRTLSDKELTVWTLLDDLRSGALVNDLPAVGQP